MLRITSGRHTPSWVPNQITMSFTAGGSAGHQTITMPRPWDSSYLTPFKQFIGVCAARYNGDPRIAAIQMTGGGWEGEMTLPRWSGWPGAGYTDAKIEATWDTLVDSYRAAFTRTPSALDLGDPLPGSTALVPIMQHAATYGSAVHFQQNGLTANGAGTYVAMLTQRSSSTTVGWQMWGGGNSATYLRQAFGIAISSRARYVEVYLDDCVNKANLSALRYLAAG